MKYKNGFTLIELIVVIGIIGILSGIVILFINGAKTNSDDIAKIRSLQEIRSALQLYFSDNGYFPSNDLNVLITEKKIASINKNILYQPINTDMTLCSNNCQSYHLGISLSKNNYPALKGNANINLGFDGTKDNCVNGNFSTPDKCYDIVP